ncbi:PPOX class F420-dependent oxidoreductase [Actinoplanes sp. NPDC051861]|uniref:PPOX class F420-dependent oxidoreductase n=1 Tax=Actinoplanes sp. NPDC051861 TaxID=3155170 RepID=UPI00343A0421
MGVPEEIARSKYVRLTTYRKDGTPVVSPVWQATVGGLMYIVSDADAWKVKRIRRDGRVLVTVCDLRGRVKDGAVSAEGVARVLDEEGTREARAIIARKYLTSRVGNWVARTLRLPKPPVVGISVSI